MDNPAFEEEFTALAKGLPDLERIVSRIHAKNCKVKDFLHARATVRVRWTSGWSTRGMIHVQFA